MNLRLIVPFVRLSLAAVLLCTSALSAVSGLVACSSSPSPKETTDDGGTSSPDGASCGAIAISPAIVTVVANDGEGEACKATLTLLSVSDGGLLPQDDATAVSCNAGAPLAGCPAAPADGGVAPCAYAIPWDYEGSGPTWGSYVVEVAQAGFVSTQVTVSTGVSGCVGAPVEPSDVTVTLQAEADGGGG